MTNTLALSHTFLDQKNFPFQKTTLKSKARLVNCGFTSQALILNNRSIALYPGAILLLDEGDTVRYNTNTLEMQFED